ncbi:NAD(P)-dependent oxidoreductase [Limosilactobacillus panis]|uniref:4-phosphoerythronate dehydrogenase n=1 Tax=Limosilactobacillus panis DSM 6035 TaxID=1423782 RepID=A0A0R1X8P9_9LACO|nr:NAD(P)-dependent oxidoreductase [Limosilactobacillus panis]KRM26384.1 4-phosphoerythronate dehydrogenase [Limosilactobacillus panis DSM 6035]
MKIVIADYPESMMKSHQLEKKVLQAGLSGCQVVVFPYHDDHRAAFLEEIHDADALLTAFIKVDEEVLRAAPQLKEVSINATGYDNVDLAAARQHGVAVCPVGEYCTEDVAEFTITTMLALVRNLKAYLNAVDHQHEWRYDYAQPNCRLSNMTLGIFGLGKIGRAVATKAAALGMTVIANDPFISKANYAKVADRVRLTSVNDILATADVITNHMNLNDSNHHFFTADRFQKMAKHPYFLNMARGAEVNEDDLVQALDKRQIKGAALDVLATEFPDLAHNPLVDRENVLVTPHTAFYSTDSVTALQRISCQNIVDYLTGHPEKVFKLVVNPQEGGEQ